MKENEKRFEYLDYIRVFATVMVIIIHCIYEYLGDFSNKGSILWTSLVFVNELLRTGVPLFFMMSGYLLLQKDITDIKAFYKKRFVKIAIPFLVYDIFYFILNSIIYKTDFSVMRFLRELADRGSAYHLWFVYSILFIYLLMPFLRMIVSKCTVKTLFLFLVLCGFQTTVRPILNIIFNGKLHFYLTDDGIMGYVGYVILGYLMGNFNFSKKTEKIIYLLGIVSFILFPIWNIYTTETTGDLFFNGGYTLNHYIEAAAVFLFFKNHIHKSNKFISELSAVSFSAYLIHVAILNIVQLLDFGTDVGNTMLIWSVSVVFLSFLWGFAEKLVTGSKF